MSPFETRIDPFSVNKTIIYSFRKSSITNLIKATLGYSLNENQELSFIGPNVPVLWGLLYRSFQSLPYKIKTR